MPTAPGANSTDATLKMAPPLRNRRRSDRMMRWRMIWAATGMLVFNLLASILVFELDLLHPLYEFMAAHSEIEDKIVVFSLMASGSVIFLLILYSLKVSALLTDVQRLVHERDRLRDVAAKREKLEALGVITAGVSHEINSSLQAVLGSCEMARNRLSDPKAALQFVERAIESSLHARRVIGNVLVFARDGGGVHGTPVNMEEILEKSIDYAMAFLPTTISIQVNMMDHRNVMLFADQIALMQVVGNLLTNAAHAMDYTGIIKVVGGKAKLEQAEATARGLEPGMYGRIEVVDSGRGISKENLGKIFDPFFTTKVTGEGTGLGLSIVHGMVRSMKGFIDVNSEEGKGTTFTLMLPRAGGNHHDHQA